MSIKSIYLYISTYKGAIMKWYWYKYHLIEKREAYRMKKFIQNKLKEQKGLTLIELLAVIVILAIIAAIAVPAIGNIIENSRYSAVKADATNALSAANIYFAENPSEKSVSIATLANGYLDNAGKLNKTGAITTHFVYKDAGTVKLTHPAITYSGSKTVTFANASISDINSDSNKGSAAGPFSIGSGTGVAPTQ